MIARAVIHSKEIKEYLHQQPFYSCSTLKAVKGMFINMKEKYASPIGLFPHKQKALIKREDIYLTKEYAKLYEEKENGIAKVFDFTSPHGKVRNIFIKREIPYGIDRQTYYDILTPYGYGGPFILESSNTKLLLKEYFEAFNQYCLSENIVSEFVRFHLFKNQEVRIHFDGETQLIGQHIVKDLNEPAEENLHKSVLQAVRRAKRLGVEIVIDQEGTYLDDFLNIYHTTMDMHRAKDFYYFDKSFFEHIHESLQNHHFYIHAVVDGKIIGTRLIMYGEKYTYYFLGGVLREYSTYKAATLLDYEIIKYLKKQGKEYYIFGGGYKGEDSLYKYKKKFSETGQVPFYIGKKIHDVEAYEQLKKMRSSDDDYDPNSSFFPIYRL